MTIKKIEGTVCDLQGCSNLATTQILFEKSSKEGICLCESCLKNLIKIAKGEGDENVKGKKR